MNIRGGLFLGLAALLLGTPGCGGGSCENPNPNHNAADPTSEACLDVPDTGIGTASATLQVTGVSFTLANPTQDETVQLSGSGSEAAGSNASSEAGTGNGDVNENSASSGVSGTANSSEGVGTEPRVTNTTNDSSEAQTGSTSGVLPGQVIVISVPFSAPNGNVMGVGIQFDGGPIQVVEVPGALGQTSGVLNAEVTVPQSVCNNLSQICHDIKCYEFAVTDAGQVSAANINQIALKCGKCDEPSCQSLLTECDEETCGNGVLDPGETCDPASEEPCKTSGSDCQFTDASCATYELDGDPSACTSMCVLVDEVVCDEGEICSNGECEPISEENSCGAANTCCPEQDNSCQPPGASCFCDEYCITAGDCCPDYVATCGGG